MKRSDAIKKIQEIETAIEVQRLEKLRQMEAEMDLENRESNRYRARSITVGTSFGGTSEVMMRGDGSKHMWCVLQPCEVVELINQLAANVGCNVALKPRDDFASWRDWRVSEAEKKHLNRHVPFVNDMTVFQKLGASGYNDEEAKKIMNVLATVREFANENDDTKIFMQETKDHGGPSIMYGQEDGLIHNKVALDENGDVLYMAGGDGGGSYLRKVKNEEVATKKTVNRRSSK